MGGGRLWWVAVGCKWVAVGCSGWRSVVNGWRSVAKIMRVRIVE